MSMKKEGPAPTDIVDAILDAARWSEIKPMQMEQWVRLACNLTEKIAAGTTDPSEHAMFWIRLNEILQNLFIHFKETIERGIKEPQVISLFQTLKTLRKHFTEDDLLVIEYERDSNAHIFQDGYRVQIQETKAIRNFKSSGRDRKEVQAIVKKALVGADGKDEVLAGQYAKRVLVDLTTLRDQIHEWTKE